MNRTALSSARRLVQAAPPIRRFQMISGRIVGRGDRRLMLSHYNSGGVHFDFVTSTDGEHVRLASGNSVLGRFLIAPAWAGIPGALPYWGGPGTGLWEAVSQLFSPATWQQIDAYPGRVLTREQLRSVLEVLFTEAARHGTVVAGKELPLGPAASFVRVDLALHSLWIWDIVTEQAFPHPHVGGAPLIAVRMMSSDEWEGLARPRSPEAAASVNTGPSQQEVDEWVMKYFQARREAGLPPPKVNDDAYPACRTAIAATQRQFRDSMRRLPAGLKRGHGRPSQK